MVPQEEGFHDLIAEVAERLSEDRISGEYQFWEGPDILEEIRTGKLRLGDILFSAERSELREVISGLIGLLVRRHFGDEIAHQQLNIIHSFMFPKQYEVPEHVIEKLSKKYRSGHLTRAWELRKLMYEISDLVVPTKTNAENILKSPVQLLPQADRKHSLYPLVKKHLKRGTTLQILAIRIYLEMVNEREDQGAIDERTLKRDLQRLRKWEESDVEHMRRKKELTAAGTEVSWKAPIPVRKYSESWFPSLREDSQESEDTVGGKTQPDKKRTPKK
jgi:hypothetical protein